MDDGSVKITLFYCRRLICWQFVLLILFTVYGFLLFEGRPLYLYWINKRLPLCFFLYIFKSNFEPYEVFTMVSIYLFTSVNSITLSPVDWLNGHLHMIEEGRG